MKKMPVFILLFLAFPAFSQIQKNQWLIGGNAAFSYSKSADLKTTSIQIAPDIGYFFINKLAGGFRFNAGIDTYDPKDNGYRITNAAVSPFLRYYCLPEYQKINLFAEGAYSYGWRKYKDIDYRSSYTYHYNSFSVLAGPAIFLNQHTALEITLGYTHTTRGPIDSATTNKFQLGVGLQIHFGKAK